MAQLNTNSHKGGELPVHTSHLVDGYYQAFVDSSAEADPSCTPRFVTNSNGRTVRAVIENELKDCSEMFMSVAFIFVEGFRY